jgi:hypothetical protein
MRDDNFRRNMRRLFIYSVCFLLIFNVGFQQITDSVQTTQVLILATVLFSIAVIFVWVCISAFFFKMLHLQNKLIYFLLLYLLSEVIVGLFTGGETFLFGLMPRLQGSGGVSEDVILYRNDTAVLFSSALLVSAIISLMYEQIFPLETTKD